MGLMQLLREETRPAHERLEARVACRLRLLAPDLSPREYRAALEWFWGLYVPLEARLAACPAWDTAALDVSARRKVPLLARDLAYLGVTPEQMAELPRCPRLPQVDRLPEAVGCLYVLEGATLGGQVICRHLRRSLGPSIASAGAAFFHSYGEAVGRMWRAFGEFAERAVADRRSRAAAVETASATFAAFDHWLSAETERVRACAAGAGAEN